MTAAANTLATRHFVVQPALRTQRGAALCRNFAEPRTLPSNRMVTCRGIVIGGAIAPTLPTMTQHGELIQAALLDARTATARPLLARVAGAFWGWC